MKDSQHEHGRSAKREPDEEKRKGAPGGAGMQRGSGARGGSEGSDRPEREGQVRMDLTQLIESLRQQFEQDRALASQPGTARCGICYLYYRQAELFYREEEGFYVCKSCQRALGATKIKMLHRQQR